MYYISQVKPTYYTEDLKYKFLRTYDNWQGNSLVTTILTTEKL